MQVTNFPNNTEFSKLVILNALTMNSSSRNYEKGSIYSIAAFLFFSEYDENT